MRPEVFKKVEDDLFALSFNMNDTFYYACSDCCSIDVTDFNDLEDVIEKYGWWALVAYEAIKRGHDPQIPKNADDPEFKKAKEMILEIIAKAQGFGPLYELRQSLELKPHTPKERKKLASWMSRGVDRVFSFFMGR